jgi:hypothetical protein
MSKLKELHQLYGINLELNKLEQCSKDDPAAIPFVSRTDKNNGVSAFVKRVASIVPNTSNTISVAGGGSVLASFVQPQPYYSGRDLYILTPKKPMSDVEMVFYCHCIRQNRYKYNYGRQANKTLRDLLVPSTAPLWVKKINPIETDKLSETLVKTALGLNVKTWKWFKLSDIFEIERGRGPRLNALNENGDTPVVTSMDQNNGWNTYTEEKPIHPGNVITVNRNGSVGEAFYQPRSFCSTEDVHIFKPKFDLNKFNALFLVTVIRKEKYRYNYGRKWGLSRMRQSYIKLPANGKNEPDYSYMEEYIKSLPYSASI